MNIDQCTFLLHHHLLLTLSQHDGIDWKSMALACASLRGHVAVVAQAPELSRCCSSLSIHDLAIERYAGLLQQ